MLPSSPVCPMREPDGRAYRELALAGRRLQEPVFHAGQSPTRSNEGSVAPRTRRDGIARNGAPFHPEHPCREHRHPGMRRLWHVEHNLAASDGQPLSPRLRDALRQHRWDRGTLISSRRRPGVIIEVSLETQRTKEHAEGRHPPEIPPVDGCACGATEDPVHRRNCT